MTLRQKALQPKSTNGCRKENDMISYIKCLGKYSSFSGRSTRREFWGFAIINFLILFGLFYLQATVQVSESSNVATAKTLRTVIDFGIILYILLTLSPALAAMCRRWHDLGRTGKWLWLNFVPVVGTVVSLFFFLGKGDEGTNDYGRDPRERKYKRRR